MIFLFLIVLHVGIIFSGVVYRPLPMWFLTFNVIMAIYNFVCFYGYVRKLV